MRELLVRNLAKWDNLNQLHLSHLASLKSLLISPINMLGNLMMEAQLKVATAMGLQMLPPCPASKFMTISKNLKWISLQGWPLLRNLSRWHQPRQSYFVNNKIKHMIYRNWLTWNLKYLKTSSSRLQLNLFKQDKRNLSWLRLHLMRWSNRQRSTSTSLMRWQQVLSQATRSE